MTDTRWLDSDELRAWLRLAGVMLKLAPALDSQLQRDSDMTHFEFMVLSTLQQAKGAALRTTDLAAAVNSTMPRLSRVIGKLAERGLVERRSTEGDARVKIVHLTTAGRRELVRAVPRHIARVKELVIDRLTSDELEGVTAALEPLVERLDPQQRVGFGERAASG